MSRRVRKLYIFIGAGHDDYTAGDRIVTAFSKEEAHAIVGNARTRFGGDAGPWPDPEEHDIPGFDYMGPGGG